MKVKARNIKVLAALFVVLLCIAFGLFGFAQTAQAAAKDSVTYRTHVQNVGWQGWKSDGTVAGTTGKSLRLEGVNIKLKSQSVTGSIQYRTHVQNIGWQGWKQDGALSGTTGRSLRLEAIQIKLTGKMAETYDIYYRVHAQNYGWMGWAKNGASAGTAGYAYRLEAIQIKLVKKGGAAPGSTTRPFIQKTREVRGLWVAYCDFANLGLKDKSKATFAANYRKMLTKAKSYGVNTIYFHVRAFDDASWKSNTFKASKYLTSNASEGRTAAKTYSYDPLQVVIDETHKAGMQLHAWMNPYRVTLDYYYDPAKTASKNRILKAVDELLKYDIDGIHFDDYFYNAKKGYIDVGTSASQLASKSRKAGISAATKRANVNPMVKAVYSKAHSVKGVSFGISTQGNYENCMADGADVATWLSKKGYVDYLAPQIYWTDNWGKNGGTTMFTNRLKLFKGKNKIGIPLYAGLALYRTGYSQSDDYGWGHSYSNLASQLKKLRAQGYKGFILFSGEYLYKSRCSKELANLKKAL